MRCTAFRLCRLRLLKVAEDQVNARCLQKMHVIAHACAQARLYCSAVARIHTRLLSSGKYMSHTQMGDVRQEGVTHH